MSSWVLLLAALAACVRFARAEGDPLPPSLVELVRNSPISSIQDLQLLLEPDSVDEVSDGQRHHANSTSKRFPRSLAAEQAQQAQCKVRTEVLEVTRDMLDRRNANFLLWPPCVEVQRCSGCCNSRALQCTPTVSHTRNLQVLKIQYINKRPHYEKAVISVQDHVECRCQSSAPPAAPRTTAKKPQNAPQPHRPAPKPPLLKTPSKEELHRHDELKRNQSPPSHFPVAGTTQRPPPQGSRTRGDAWQGGAGREEPPPTQEAHGAHRGEEEPDRGGGERPLTGEQGGGVERRGEQSKATGSERPAMGEGEEGTRTAPVESQLRHASEPHGHAEQDHKHSHGHHDQTKATEQSRHSGQQLEDRQPPGAEGGPLPRLNPHRERDRLLTSQGKPDQEKEREKLQQEEVQQRHNPHHQNHQNQHVHHQVQMHTTTQRPVTAAPTTTRRPATQRPPARHHPFQRRLRKNRRRMSKAAMRAMLM